MEPRACFRARVATGRNTSLTRGGASCVSCQKCARSANRSASRNKHAAKWSKYGCTRMCTPASFFCVDSVSWRRRNKPERASFARSPSPSPPSSPAFFFVSRPANASASPRARSLSSASRASRACGLPAFQRLICAVWNWSKAPHAKTVGMPIWRSLCGISRGTPNVGVSRTRERCDSVKCTGLHFCDTSHLPRRPPLERTKRATHSAETRKGRVTLGGAYHFSSSPGDDTRMTRDTSFGNLVAYKHETTPPRDRPHSTKGGLFRVRASEVMFSFTSSFVCWLCVIETTPARSGSDRPSPSPRGAHPTRRSTARRRATNASGW
mmetsp:Transcript_2128/g.8837  ORF Transcript_2128/g.8837 Transcript_2128/m.8837 type:complete len:323 (-) Transcript_2128:372-1340(-)